MKFIILLLPEPGSNSLRGINMSLLAGCVTIDDTRGNA
jgi:hypothetical protein